MGGPGSGCWSEESYKTLTTELHHLDVHRLRREGHIVPGQTSLVLTQGVCVPIQWTPCHFGGQRPWLMCSSEPCPQPRRAILYLARGKPRLLCRDCLDLQYPSKRETDLGRAKRKTHQALQRLGVPSGELADFQGKPKNMHHSTFVRLGHEYLQAREHWARLTKAYNDQCAIRNQFHLAELRKPLDEL